MGDFTVPAGSFVKGELKYQVASLVYDYSVVDTPQFSVGLQIGAEKRCIDHARCAAHPEKRGVGAAVHRHVRCVIAVHRDAGGKEAAREGRRRQSAGERAGLGLIAVEASGASTPGPRHF